MKNFQVRLDDEVYKILQEVAATRGISVADVMREAFEIYTIGIDYVEQGKHLFWEDPKRGEKAELLIPGFTLKPRRKSLLGRMIRSQKPVHRAIGE
jgi:hypothetical protein